MAEKKEVALLFSQCSRFGVVRPDGEPKESNFAGLDGTGGLWASQWIFHDPRTDPESDLQWTCRLKNKLMIVSGEMIVSVFHLH